MDEINNDELKRLKELVTIDRLNNEIELNRYEFIKLIGKGSFGDVYKANDKRLNKVVAIKSISTDKFNIDELNLLMNINNEGFPKVYDFIQIKDECFLVMEYIEGISLKEYLKIKEYLDVNICIQIFKKLLNIIKYLHDMSPAIIYRDLKPENIIINNDMNVILIDFGAAFYRDYSGNDGRNTYGTKGYSAPELFMYKVANKEADIYSLGVIMHEMLTFREKSSDVVLCPVTEQNASVSKRLEKIVSKCIKEDPSERYHDVGQILDDLKQIKKGDDLMVNIKKIMVMCSYIAALSYSLINIGKDWTMNISKESLLWLIVKVLLAFLISFTIHYLLIYRGMGRRSIRVNKEIFLSSKRYAGLLSGLIFLSGVFIGNSLGNNFAHIDKVYAASDSKDMWVDIKDVTERKVLLKKDSVYEMDDKLRLEIPAVNLPMEEMIIKVVASTSNGENFTSREFNIKRVDG